MLQSSSARFDPVTRFSFGVLIWNNCLKVLRASGSAVPLRPCLYVASTWWAVHTEDGLNLRYIAVELVVL